MNTEQIEKVIESIAKSGYTPERKTHIDKHISLDYGRCKFTLNHKGDQLIVGVTNEPSMKPDVFTEEIVKDMEEQAEMFEKVLDIVKEEC